MKKALAAVLAAVIAAGSALTCAAAHRPRMGDVNLDGIASISDATTIQKHLASYFTLSEAQRKYADVDQNGTVSISDVTYMQRALAGSCTLPEPAPLSDEEMKGAGNLAMNDFAVKLLQNGRKHKTNVLISPLSIMNAMGMTANGAKGRTLSQIEDAFGMTLESINRYCKYYLDNQTSSTGKTRDKFTLANSIWFNKAYDPVTLNPNFAAVASDNYKAQLNTLFFNSDATQQINDWVNTNTDGMVPTILDEADPGALMYLINALAFDGKWDEPYDPEYQVSQGKFTNADNTTTNANYMVSSEYKYISGTDSRGFIKEFADGTYAFAALLPDENTTLDSFVKSLTGDKLSALLNSVKSENTIVYLPKFKLDYSEELTESLTSLGISDAFNPACADFTNMLTEPLIRPYISRVLHKTSIDVNETGTKAGAATLVEMKEGTAPGEPNRVKLDRPFVYMIIDLKTKTPFFIGAVDSLQNAQ